MKPGFYPVSRLQPAIAAFFKELGIPQSEWQDGSLDLHHTPARIAKALKNELLSSYKLGAYEKLVRGFTCFPAKRNTAMVLEANIEFSSQCAHHLLPFIGIAHVAYIPDRKIIGASKLARVVEHYAKMLQIQERMTQQVSNFIFEKAQPKVVITMIEANHLCMAVRGVKQANTKMVTTAIVPEVEGDDGSNWRGVISEFYNQVAMVRRP